MKAEGKNKESGIFYWYNNEKIPLKVEDKVVLLLKEGMVKDKFTISFQQEYSKDVSPLENNFLLCNKSIDYIDEFKSNIEEIIPVFSTVEGGMLFPSKEIIVKFENGTSEEQRQEILERFNLKDKNSKTGLYECTTVNESINIANEIHIQKEVLYAEPNFIQIFKPFFVPNDSLYTSQWALHNTGQGGGIVGEDISAEAAWDITRGNVSIIIAVLDEGVDYNHEDLNVGSKLQIGYDALTTNNDPNPENDDAHGTACAGIATASGNNGTGISGVAPECGLLGIRIAKGVMVNGRRVWQTTNSQISDAIDTAVTRGAHVLSNSWGGGSPSSAITNSIQNARNNGRGGLGCLICFAAGNDDGAVSYPGLLSEVFTVAACNEFGERKSKVSQDGETWWGSSFGPEVDISAPGVHITTTDITGNRGYANGNYTSTFNGTSAATPHVAGVGGLILSVNSALTVAQIEDILRTTATDIESVGYDNFSGHGRVNAFAAVQKAFGTVTPRTMSLKYIDVPENEERGLSIRFDVNSMTARNFEITTPLGSPFRIVNSTAGVGNTPIFDIVRDVYLWITYRGTNDGDTIPPPPTSVTVRCIETNETWVVPISANTIRRPTTAIMLCLDQSGSMDFASGIGSSKRIDVLKYSAGILMEVIQAGNGVGIVSFDQDAHDIKIPVVGPFGEISTNIFDPSQAERNEIKDAITAFMPNLSGSTAIGDGIERAQMRINSTSGYDTKAVIVLTDGQETEAKYIADVRDQINDKVFAIGLGTAENITPASLNTLTNESGGYMLLTDALDNDSRFKLAKYFLQILAGITNENVVVDPTDTIQIDQKVKIPFIINECDISADIILMLPFREIIDLKLESPKGNIIEVSNYSGIVGVQYKPSDNVSFYRLSLPVALDGEEKVGKWHAILEINRDMYKKYFSYSRKRYSEEINKILTHGVPYTLLVHSYSNLRMKANINQNSYEVGAKMTLNVKLSEYDIPLNAWASVKAYLKNPDGTEQVLNLSLISRGNYSVQIDASLSGIYEFLVKAKGRTSRGNEFTREQVLTGSVWKGGDRIPPKSQPVDSKNDDKLCDLLSCMIGSMNENLRERLIKEGFDINRFEKCIAVKCKTGRKSGIDRKAITEMITKLSQFA